MFPKIDRHSYNGFTLIEIIASIAILSIVILVFIPIFLQIFNWSDRSEENLTASNLLGQISYDVKNNTDDDWKSFLEGKTINTCNVSVPSEDDYKNYILNNETYEAKLSVCHEDKVDLYRVHIQVFNSDRKVTESYTYMPVVGEMNE